MARQRQVYRNHELVNNWASGLTAGRNPRGTITIRDGVLYSCAVPIGHRINTPSGTAVLVATSTKHAVTTTRHAGLIWRCSYGSAAKPVFMCPVTSSKPTYSDMHRYLLEQYCSYAVRFASVRYPDGHWISRHLSDLAARIARLNAIFEQVGTPEIIQLISYAVTRVRDERARAARRRAYRATTRRRCVPSQASLLEFRLLLLQAENAKLKELIPANRPLPNTSDEVCLRMSRVRLPTIEVKNE